jgi:hypothetical protein
MKVLENILQEFENVKVIDANWLSIYSIDISINNEIFKKQNIDNADFETYIENYLWK